MALEIAARWGWSFTSLVGEELRMTPCLWNSDYAVVVAGEDWDRSMCGGRRASRAFQTFAFGGDEVVAVVELRGSDPSRAGVKAFAAAIMETRYSVRRIPLRIALMCTCSQTSVGTFLR